MVRRIRRSLNQAEVEQNGGFLSDEDGAESQRASEHWRGQLQLALAGMRWSVLTNIVAAGGILWWMLIGSGYAFSSVELERSFFSLAIVALIDLIILLPVTGRFIIRSSDNLGLSVFCGLNFFSAAAWIVMITGFKEFHSSLVVLTLVGSGIAIIATAFLPFALVSRIIAAVCAFAMLGQGAEMKAILIAMCIITSAMTVSLSRRRSVMNGNFNGEHRKALSAQSMVASFEQSGRGWFWQTNEDGALTYISQSTAARLGYHADAVAGRSFASLVSSEAADSSLPDAVDRTLGFTLAAGVDFTDLVVRVAGEEDIWWSLSGVAIHDAKGRCVGFRGSGIDLTEQRRSEAEARQLANYDALTGLANRAMIRRTLEDVMVPVNNSQPDCGLMLLDLDRFKNVNDTLGHPVGDELLKIVAKRLSRVVGHHCQVGRLGGDEFKVIVPDFGDRSELGRMADAIIDRLSLPYVIDGVSIQIGASVGIAVAPTDGICADELTRNADLALYAAKAAGKGVHRFYEPGMHTEADERRALEHDLRDMLSNNQLTVAYQPVVDARSEQVVGFEALARWEHPEKGDIPPAVFIPIAEEIGLVGRIGEAVMREACRQAVQWPDHLHIAVNLSPRQFEALGLPNSLIQILHETGLAPERLELEITEGTVLTESTTADEMLATLCGHGVRLALDDFGTGYASLGYLRRIPFSKIKVDKSFVRGANESGNRNSAIIKAIVSLAESLGMETVAEGVETLDEIALIRSLGCTQIQGFIFGEPMNAAEAAVRAARALPVSARGGPEDPLDRDVRISLLRVARMTSGRSHAMAKIRNISAKGALVEVPGDVSIGPSMELQLSDGLKLCGEVRWRKGHRVGLHFVEAVDVDAIVGKPGLLKAQSAPEGQGGSAAAA